MEEDPGAHGEEPMEVMEDSVIQDSAPIDEDSSHIAEDSTHIHIEEHSIHIAEDSSQIVEDSHHIAEVSTHNPEEHELEIVDSALKAVDSALEADPSVLEAGSSSLEVDPGVGEQQVVQIIMQGGPDSEAASFPEGQMIQLNTSEGMMQYIQVVNEHGENQLIQVSSDGQAQYVQLSNSEGDGEGQAQYIQLANSDGGSELFQISNEPPDELLEEEAVVKREEHTQVTEVTEVAEPGDHTAVLEASSMMMPASSMEEMEQKPQDLIQAAPPGSSLLNTSSVTSIVAPMSSKASHDEVADIQSNPDTVQPNEYFSVAEPEAAPIKTEKVVDTSKPIELTSETVVTIGGKKCVLRVDPSTNHLVAYPVAKPGFTPGRRPRGRPRKVRRDSDNVPIQLSDGDEGSQDSSDRTESAELKPSLAPSEQENSAAEGLLGLSEADGRRKSLRVKKKSKVLQDYETGAIEGVEEETEEVDEADIAADPDVPEPPSLPTPGIVKRGRGRPPKNPNTALNTSHQVQNFLANLGLPVKRGRGRPRRTPPSGGLFNGPIPAFIIPSPGGQAVMMAPIQSTNWQSLQKSGQLADILPKTSMAQSSASDQMPVIIQNADGTQTHIIRAALDNVKEEGELRVEGAPGEEGGGEADGAAEEVSGEMDSMEGAENTEGGVNENGESPKGSLSQPATSSSSSKMQPTAIIQLPQNLIPLLLPKKDPVKIGLKASEQDLEKTKCPKCNVQTFYQKQYQEHLQEHADEDDIHKCKCCAYLTFDCDDLLRHFKASHPKCICDVCEFTAEHAYVIKRHMLRHSAKGCECEVCGKTYKDQYILKMHIKMVHMPAEVLFECNVCAKKFNRKAHLKRHLRIHEPEKPFKCPHCDYRGCERSDVSKHLLIHDDPQHHCEVCGKTFRHVKNKELHVKRHKGQRDYKCGVCDFYGYTFTDIRKHIERKHADTRTILCDKCGSAFKSDNALREHKRKQCEVVMIEQALAMAEVEDHQSEDGTTVPIPGVPLDSQIMVDGNHINIGNQVNITVEQVPLHEEDNISVSLCDGVMVTEDGCIVSQAEVMEAASHPELSHIMEATVIDTSQVEMSETELAQTELTQTELSHSQVEFVATDEDGMIAITE